MRLTEAQKTNPLWHALRVQYSERLAQLRVENDNSNLDPLQTAALRARISEVKMLLDMDSPEPEEILISGM